MSSLIVNMFVWSIGKQYKQDSGQFHFDGLKMSCSMAGGGLAQTVAERLADQIQVM